MTSNLKTEMENGGYYNQMTLREGNGGWRTCVQIQPLAWSAFNLRLLLPHSLLVVLVRLLVGWSVGYDNFQRACKETFTMHVIHRSYSS